MTDEDDIKRSSNSTLDRVLEMGSLVRMFGGWIFGAITLVVTVIFWIQSQGNDKYYPKIAGENLKEEVMKVEQRLDGLEQGNLKIIEILGRLEATQEQSVRNK